MMRAGFAEVDITPPLGIYKMGWKRLIVADAVLDPLYARVAVIESGDRRAAFVQLDTAVVERDVALRIRRRVEEQYDFPGDAVMVAATHNHAGPAVGYDGDVKPDEAYVASLIDKATQAFGGALAGLAPVEAGFGHGYEFRVAHNRRVVMRDGTVRTHGNFSHPDALFIEGPIDPEVTVMALRRPGGGLAAALVNFACHPTHEGGSGKLTAGFPGVLARRLAASGCPLTLFLNGAAGNAHSDRPAEGGRPRPMAECGELLAETVLEILNRIEYRPELPLTCARTEIELPYRKLNDQEIQGTARGAQRFIDPKIYEREIAALTRHIAANPAERAEVQAIGFGEHAFVSVPGELFAELGLELKVRAYPTRVAVVGYANGSVGYLPHRAAFERGGYETTFCGSSRLAPGAGEMVVDAAARLVAALS